MKKSSTQKSEDFADFLKNLITGVDSDHVTIGSQKDEEETGAFTVEFSGRSEMGWDEYNNRKGARFPFSNNASSWNPDFGRAEGEFKEARVVLDPSYWQRETETVLLPNIRGFSIDDATPIDRKLAGTHIWRTISMEGNKVTSITNFRQFEQDIAAEEARAAEGELAEISENWAYLVGPRSLRPKKR
jgi:hypothetical protein